MAKHIKKLSDIPRQRLQELQGHARFKQRFLIFNVLPLAFVMTSIAFLVVIVLGVIPAANAEQPSPIWPALVVVGFFEVPVLFFLVGRMLKPLRQARTLDAAGARGNVPMVLALAFSESICIYALVGPAMAMPQLAQLGLWAFGFVVLVGSHVWVRGQVREAMLLGLANDLASEAG